MERFEPDRTYIEADLETADFQYEYPDGLDLHPKSELHRFLVQQITDKVEESRWVSTSVTDEWKLLDESLTAYVPKNDAEETLSQDRRKPVAIIIPMMFASKELMLTYLSSVFLRDPIFPLAGRGSKRAIIGAALLERVMQTQNVWFKNGLKLMTHFNDALVYGMGAIAPQWTKHSAVRHVDAEVEDVLYELIKGAMPDVKPGDLIRYLEETVLFEGNKFRNLDPYKLFLDANTPVNDYQDADFMGFINRHNVMRLTNKETDPEERRFNGKYVRICAEHGDGASQYWTDDSGRRSRYNDTYTPGTREANKSVVDEISMIMEIVPKEWHLGDGDRAEKWMFSLASDRVITQCQPLELDHGMYPITLCGPNTSGYDIYPVSHMATAFGGQKTLDWIIRSYVDEVRKGINGWILFDPTKIETDDLLNPRPHKMIRLKQASYGEQDLGNYMKQFDFQSAASNHLAHAGVFTDFLNRVLGTENIMSGDLTGMPERPGKAGIAAATQGGFSRMKRVAMMISEQSLRDLAWQSAYNTMQFMSQDVAVPIIGSRERELREEYGDNGEEEVWVSPWDLDPNFDVVPRDGSLPSTENIDAMTAVIQSVMSVEGVPQSLFSNLNVMGMFLQWARKSGFENVHEFVLQTGGGIQTQVMPDEQVMDGVAAGEYVPMEQALNAT